MELCGTLYSGLVNFINVELFITILVQFTELEDTDLTAEVAGWVSGSWVKGLQPDITFH